MKKVAISDQTHAVLKRLAEKMSLSLGGTVEGAILSAVSWYLKNPSEGSCCDYRDYDLIFWGEHCHGLEGRIHPRRVS
jgi:hypothetical protein